MKPKDVVAALESGDPDRVLIRNGGWHGLPQQRLKMKPAFEGESDPFVVQIFSAQDGQAVHEMWVDAENILAVCVPIIPIYP